MVGLPGKSKGCHTCRRRKVACDLQQPSCQRCVQSNRPCEGYDRYPVFLNRTLEGLQRRHRLEEAIPHSGPVSAESSSVDPLSGLDTYSSEERLGYLSTQMPSPLHSASTFDSTLFSAFLDIYLPSTANPPSDSMRIWLHEAIDFNASDRALQPSLRALSMNRVGWANNNSALIMQGRVAYNLALHELQKALWDENIMYRDETLAAARALMAYDIFESTLGSADSWKAHQAGLAHLVWARGLASYSSPLGLALLEEIRNTSMFFSLQHRTSSFLGSPPWRTEPWRHKSKNIEQMLYDRGFELAALVAKIDQVMHSNSTDAVSSQTMLKYLNDCSALDTGLDAWYQELLRVSPSPLYWVSDSDFPNRAEASGPSTRSLAAYAFSSLRLALVILNFWALRLILSTTVGDACNIILRTQHVNPLELLTEFGSNTEGKNRAKDRSTQDKSVIEEMACRHGHERCFALAVDITRAIPYCTSENMGLLGPQKSLFALRVALFYLRLHPGQELGQCWTLYQELTTKKGVRLAQDLQRAWAESEHERGSDDGA